MRRRKVFETALFKMEYVGELADVRLQHVKNSCEAREKFARDLAAAAQAQSVQLQVLPEEAALGLHSLFVGLIHGWTLTEGSFSLLKAGSMSVDVYLSGLGFRVSL